MSVSNSKLHPPTNLQESPKASTRVKTNASTCGPSSLSVHCGISRPSGSHYTHTSRAKPISCLLTSTYTYIHNHKAARWAVPAGAAPSLQNLTRRARERGVFLVARQRVCGACNAAPPTLRLPAAHGARTTHATAASPLPSPHPHGRNFGQRSPPCGLTDWCRRRRRRLRCRARA